MVRFIVDNIGGINVGTRIARLAERFGLEYAPHNRGEALDDAVHFHGELAMPDNVLFEMTVPQGSGDRPAKPELGCEMDRDILDRMT